ncbi:hypothetical protein RISK_005202 [Rhodopirellula islandica]|uniref:Uncharacterized protein n=1 Tax=Rhodopirellula islandica TaxID=595434 RepID=A0A0J1B8X8_RHOIS|nr:hypothetical protein RISK_005202 [Rhodopirellula islandica]
MGGCKPVESERDDQSATHIVMAELEEGLGCSESLTENESVYASAHGIADPQFKDETILHRIRGKLLLHPLRMLWIE